MNANELADVLEELHEQDKIDGVAHLAMPEAATMLRQQQAEIEALKRQVGILRQDVENWMDNAGQQPDEAYWERLLK